MKTLFLITNCTCDIACTYCFYNTGYERRSSDRIRADQATHIAERITALNFQTVILTGGDPLQSQYKSEAYALVRELKRCDRTVFISTSGAFLNDVDLDTIVSLNVDRIDVSIDSHLAEIHNAQRGRHADAVRTIVGLLRRDFRSISTTTVVTAANAPTLKHTIQWLQELGVRDIRVQRVFIPQDAGSLHHLIQPGLHAAGTRLSTPHTESYIELTARAFSDQPPLPPATCRMGKEYFVCDATGGLTACFHRPDMALGNLFSDPIESLRRSLAANPLSLTSMPPCFGRHCVSLFDNPRFWRKEYVAI